MEKWVTIHTVNLPQDSYLIKSLLESCDIDVYLKDELTIQADNFLSNAMGGVKIQVPSLKALEAIKILEEHGYINQQSKDGSNFWLWIEKKVSHIPVLKNLHPVFVFILIVALLLFMLILFPLIHDSIYS